MANISSFFGALSFEYANTPWTIEGYLLAYEILLSQDCDYCNYGFSMEDDAKETSANFIATIFNKDAISFWGSGRWSAANNFECLPEWSKTKGNLNLISEDQYKKVYEDLLLAMYDNEWQISFDVKDEEGGVGFIHIFSVILYATKDAQNNLIFKTTITDEEEYDYNLHEFTRHYEEESDGRSETFYDVCDALMSSLDIPKEQSEIFYDFILSHKLDKVLSPYIREDYTVNDLPENFMEKWRQYKDEKIS